MKENHFFLNNNNLFFNTVTTYCYTFFQQKFPVFNCHEGKMFFPLNNTLAFNNFGSKMLTFQQFFSFNFGNNQKLD